MQLVIGRIARAHGIGGEVAVDVRTDAPELRFADDAVLATDPPERGPLTVKRARWHAGRLLISFAQVTDRNAAEALRGTLLVADSATSPDHQDPDEFWDHDLVGIKAFRTNGDLLGEVTDVLHPPGADLLVVRRPDGAVPDGAEPDLLVPFVRAIVTDVDLERRHCVVDPPEGLLEL